MCSGFAFSAALQARRRIGARDIDDWPVVALALAVNAPIWTEDVDFFGSGVATWTTRTVELYLNEGAGLMIQEPPPPEYRPTGPHCEVWHGSDAYLTNERDSW